ncbi:MAG: hypothetical protein HY298_14185 [Verrucomicrobia bacterium]|nr:hypothetical protein [Verrucomicrobiota bacterium]
MVSAVITEKTKPASGVQGKQSAIVNSATVKATRPVKHSGKPTNPILERTALGSYSLSQQKRWWMFSFGPMMASLLMLLPRRRSTQS